MGDYQKLIVSCSVRSAIKDKLDTQIEQLNLTTSAYHSGERCISLEKDLYENDVLNLVLIGQTKYGQGQKQFCEWLESYVVKGSGPDDVFAIQFSEYDGVPTLWKKE